MSQGRTAIAPANMIWGCPLGAPNGTGVLVVAGSSGRVDTARVRMLATHGVTALGLRWFGGPGLPARPREVPLEYFFAAVETLRAECDRVVLMGLSYGAEAMLLTSVHGARVDAVVALAPTHVAWECDRMADDDAPRPKWTLASKPVPFVPPDRGWVAADDPPRFVQCYETSLRSADPQTVAAAVIPVERFSGPMVLVAGGDDQVWPSARSAELMLARRSAVGRPTHVVIDADAGHTIVLPGETATPGHRPYAVGGDAHGATRLGQAAWPAIARVLAL